MNNTTFSEQIKQEICLNKYKKDMLTYLLYSFVINKCKFILSNKNLHIEMDSNFPFIIRFIGENISKFYNTQITYSYSTISNLTNSRTYKLSINGKIFVSKIQKLLTSFYKQLDLEKLNQDQKVGILIGGFLANGSVSSIEKSSYHLEIRSQNVNYLRLLQKIATELKFSPSLLKRKYWYCLYIKKATEISDFLKIIGAHNAMNQLEEKIIERDFSNQLQRLNNLDISNMNKTINSGEQELKMIRTIMNTSIYKKMPIKFKFFCGLRLKNPSLSLQELAKAYKNKYHINVTKSGINHYVIKLKKLFKDLQ